MLELELTSKIDGMYSASLGKSDVSFDEAGRRARNRRTTLCPFLWCLEWGIDSDSA
jgi:hypothetical protein